MEAKINIKNQAFLKRLETAPRAAHREMQRVNEEVYAPAIVATIKANASGRPGPNVVTGHYRDSIQAVVVEDTSMTFGTQEPQGYRLEYGFVGTDALDRTYNQPPFPHFRPAIWYWQRAWGRGMLRAAKRAVLTNRKEVPE